MESKLVTRVFVNGTFDLIHPAHLELLNYAKQHGSYLVVAIDSDSCVKRLKGQNRPVNCQQSRKLLLENLKAVDEVLIFENHQELSNIIQNYQPDVMIVGSDYRDKKVIGAEHARKLIFFERDPRYSSTKIIENITSR